MDVIEVERRRTLHAARGHCILVTSLQNCCQPLLPPTLNPSPSKRPPVALATLPVWSTTKFYII
jgi:hypothetical protein